MDTVRILLSFIFITSILQNGISGITCPEDVSYHCHIVAEGIPTTPAAHGTEEHLFLQIKFNDLVDLNQCDVGTIVRTWYVDINDNDILEPGEPSCDQLLTFSGFEVDLNIQYPNDITLSCLDEEDDFGAPIVNAGSCDLIGITYTDEIFENPANACYKILRKYRICNWCDYDPDNPNWAGEGLWEHTQVIKVVDTDKPEFSQCEDKVISLEEECMTSISLLKSAYDVGDCPASSLTWNVEVDVDLDGIIDYLYGPNEPGEFRIPNTPNNEPVEIELPGLYDRGYIEVTWKVADACGNHGLCVEKLLVKDLKRPTPYCVHPLFFTLDGTNGDSLVIPASIYDYGSYDNCPGDLKVSYSSDVNDTLKVIKCGQTGVQLNQIYITDRSGNQEFCTVYSFVFDNGSCDFSNSPSGSVTYHGSGAEPNIEAVFSNQDILDRVEVIDGHFTHRELPMLEDLVSSIVIDEKRENIALKDLILLSDHILGLKLLSDEQVVAADVNDDHKITPSDLNLMKNILLEKEELSDYWAIIANDGMTLEYEERIPYTQYDGSFDYHLLNKGDLKSLNIENETRNERIIEIAVEKKNDQYQFTNTQNFDSRGFLIKTPNLVAGSLMSISQETSTFEDKAAYLMVDKGVIHEGELSWTLEGEGRLLNDITSELDIEILDENLDKYKIVYILEKGDISLESDVKVYPTISNGVFRIEGMKIENLDLRDSAGKAVGHNLIQLSENLYEITTYNHTGLIYLRITNGNTIINQKVIKL